MNDIRAADLAVGVLMELVKRDERQLASLKLGDKLIKWSGAEVESSVAGTKSCVACPA